MKNLLFSALILAIFTLGFSASVDDDPVPYPNDGDSIPGAESMKDLKGILKLENGIEGWDAAYLTKYGYFGYTKDATTETSVDAGDEEGLYSAVTYMSLDKKDTVCLLLTREGNLPTQMITGDGIVYFSFPNDTIMELLFDNGSEIKMIDSIAYSKKELASYGDLSNDDAFKTALKNTASLISSKSEEISGIISTTFLNNRYGTKFAEISGQEFVDNPTVLSQEAVDANGKYVNIINLLLWYKHIIKNRISGIITLWTGNVTFKVGGSSCTLSGTIWFPSNIFNLFGTYGILCDTNPENLYLGKAEYEGKGYQGPNDMSFDVDFRGLKPNTTYYYRSYFHFNSEDHGGIIPHHGSTLEATFYDTTIKSFTTGGNHLTVDVVMCIDVTGSMSGIINTVKNNAIGFYDAFKECCEEESITLDALNAQVMYFRDLNVDTNWFGKSVTYSLPNQRDKFSDYVNSLYADGGGDTPESGMECLKEAFNKTDWGKDDGYHRQVVILWTDAPYLVGSYAKVTRNELHNLWNSMPSGRRLILFAPTGSYNSNGEGWENLDGWKNVIREADLHNGFYNFKYILQSIIGELTSKGKAQNKDSKANSMPSVFFQPNQK